MKWSFKLCLTIIVLFYEVLFVTGCDTAFKHHNQLNDSVKKQQAIEAYNALVIKGEPLFETNCNACHKIFASDNILAHIVQKLGTHYLKLYITKQDLLINAKDNYAIAVKKKWNNMANSHNFHFSDEELNAIIAYLNKNSK